MATSAAASRAPPRSLDALYRDEVPAALRLAYLLTGDRALAEDLVHDAFVRVASRLRSIRDPDAFGAYLRRAVANRVQSHFRHQRVVRSHLQQATAEGMAGGHDSAVEVRHMLWQALLRLPVRQRAAVVCRYYLDLSERESAELLGCRPGTVKSSLARGLAALRRLLEEETEERL